MSGKALAASRVLVTGAAGFLGSYLCRRLHEGGAEVHAVSRSDPRGDAEGVCWLRSSFDDTGEVDRILRTVRPDVIYHLGGYVTAAPDITHVLPTFSSLLASTVHVLVQAPAEVRAEEAGGPRDEHPAGGEGPPRHLHHVACGARVVTSAYSTAAGSLPARRNLFPILLASSDAGSMMG